jgi:4-diphosphocytidyl-2-C-methyl-D-erythritol kinase
MTDAPVRLRVRAPAKINLTLRILGTRPDGYHELRTMFQSLELHDTLTLKAARDTFSIECDDPRCPANEDNLVWRAATALWQCEGRRGEPRGVRIRIRKRIPMSAGLGGGSSNAAAALRGLAVLWGIAIDDDRLRTISRSLGADVPFFFEGGTVLGVDRGDLLFPLIDRPPSWVVLALPDFGVSTKEAYGWWDEDHGPEEAVPPENGNDLQGPVAARHPVIVRMTAGLRRLGATHAAMSGSGSAVFGLFDSKRKADAAARTMSGARRRAIVTRTLNRHQYVSFVRPR